MVQGPDTVIWTRKEWQQKKDSENPKVPSGLHPKVNIGDKLDKFHQANKQGYEKGAKAATELRAALVTYNTVAKQKHAKWSKRVDGLLHHVDTYIQTFANAQRAQKTYPAAHKAAVAALAQIGAEHVQWEKAGSVGQFKPPSGQKARKTLSDFSQLLLFAPLFTDKVTTRAAANFATAVELAATDWGKVIDGLLKMMPTLPATL